MTVTIAELAEELGHTEAGLRYDLRSGGWRWDAVHDTVPDEVARQILPWESSMRWRLEKSVRASAPRNTVSARHGHAQSADGLQAALRSPEPSAAS